MNRAVTQTEALREFTFAATTTLTAKQTVRTSLSGRIISGKGIAYQLTVGAKRTQVVRLPGATYVRPVPGSWSRLTKPRAVVHPTATLLALLHGLTPTFVSHPGGRTRIVGMLAAVPAKAAGVPVTGAPARAIVFLDRSGRVIEVALRSSAAAGSRTVRVAVVTHYGHFGHVPPITRP